MMMSSMTTNTYAPRSYAPMTATTTAHASMTASAAAATTEKPLLAERYKTKLCRGFVAQGCCPYETRCMFAHGEHDLRTPEMNLRDGLVTEEAVKAYQRILAQRARSAAASAAAAPVHQHQQLPAMVPAIPAPSVVAADDADETASVTGSACSFPSHGGYSSGVFVPLAAPALDASVRKVFVSGGSAYRHEPYALPIAGSSNVTPRRVVSPDNFAPRSLTPSPRTPQYAACECEDCVAAAMRIAEAY